MMVPDWLIELLRTIFGGGLIALGIELVKRYKKRERENAEISNIYKEGQELNIHIKTNIDRYVEEKTAIFKAQINELEKTIVQISSKYRNDLEKYLARIADLEKKFDEQLVRTQHVEGELSKETTARINCYDLLKSVQSKLNQIEVKNETNPPKV